MQVSSNWYWDQQPKQHVITVTICTIPHPQLEVNSVPNFHSITTSVYTRTQAEKAIPRQHICLTDSDYDYTLKEIGRRDKNDFEIYVEVYSVLMRKINMRILNEYYMYL